MDLINGIKLKVKKKINDDSDYQIENYKFDYILHSIISELKEKIVIPNVETEDNFLEEMTKLAKISYHCCR